MFKSKYKILILICIPVLLWACSTKKNTSTTRLYHSINTRYNIYFNANEAYNEALKMREQSYQDTLSQMLDIFPILASKNTFSSDDDTDDFIHPSLQQESTTHSQLGGSGSFGRSIEKTTKAIKLHSIKSKPERKPSKRRDPKYQAWLKQQEFNPFLKNAWLLLGKSEYQDADYLQSISTFLYITRLYKTDPEVVAEARIWMVKANVALGWFYEAEDILNQIRLAGGVPDRLKPEYDKVYADLLVRQKEYTKAIPYLESAIKTEKDRLQKTRMKYLLGQLYKQEGNREKAYLAFDNVHGLSTPYLYSFNARIQQASFVDSSNKQQILSQLNKMSKDHKNKDYLDQVYFAIGNIYLNDRDTVKAIENYKESIEKSTRNGYDKALTNVVLGDIYFTQRDYLKAQPAYSEALDALSKKNENYPLVALRSSVLDELVVYVEAVHLQDSLQQLARMSESERLFVINRLIEDIKKKEKEEENKERREAMLAERGQYGNTSLFEQTTPDIPTAPIVTGDGSSAFYFYNPQIVTQGKATFQRKWGTRKLEDNWRRKNKQITVVAELDDSSDEPIENDSITGNAAMPENEDIYSPEFYLQQIPLTPEAIEQSNIIIEDAYFNMGLIYKDKLGDYNLAIDAFETDLRRFPATPNLEEIYYQLFLIYLKLGDKDMMELYRRNILNAFPQGSYSAALSDDNYEWNMRNMYELEDNLYQQTYDAYLKGQVNTVRTNFNSMKEKYPLSALMPKFMFLNTLTYAQTNDRDKFKDGLKTLVETYPKADVTPLATDMLKGIMSGRELSSDSSPFRGMIWDIKFGGDSVASAEGVDFVANADEEYMLLFVYKPRTVDKNELIYEVANYNFSNFVYQTFDLGFVNVNSVEMLQVKGFKNLEDITSYIDKAFEKNSLMSKLDPSIIPIPISTDNYIALMNGKTLNEYFIFFEQNHTREMLNLVRYWTGQKERAVAEPQQEEPLPEKTPEPVEEPKIEPEPVQTDSIQLLQPQVIPTSPNMPVPEVIKKDDRQKEFGIGNILSDDQIDKADDIINKASDVISNPVDGLKNIFKSSGDNSGMTKEEKAAEKAARKLKKAQEKERKAQERAKARAEEEAEKMRQDSIENIEKEKIEAARALEKAKEQEVKAEQDAKVKARQQKQEDLKAKAKARKEELKRKEQERKERLKQKERERKEKLKQKEAERKAKERLAKQKRK